MLYQILSSPDETKTGQQLLSAPLETTGSNTSEVFFGGVKGRTIRKVMGGGGGEFFSLSYSLYEFFLGRSINIFLGLIGVHEFFFI